MRRHVLVMTLSSSVGLISIFGVDLIDLFFISLLGETALAAAVGFAGTLLFFTMAVNIGLSIAIGALVSQKLGAGDAEEARRIATSVVVFGLIVSVIVASVFWLTAPDLLSLLGATGETHDWAVRYYRIIVPTMPVSTLGIMCSGLLRAHGDAKRAMMATIAASIVNAVLDPILIFGFSLGLDGAALASVAARCAMAITSLVPVVRHYGGFPRININEFMTNIPQILGIAGPAVLTNVATPIGSSIVMRAIAPFGDSAVAGFAVMGRLTPLVFCTLFALSGAVGPIVGQNFGARQFSRVRDALLRATEFTFVYVVLATIILALTSGYIADAFSLQTEGRNLIFWFGVIVAPLFAFNGLLFVSNAAFNNLRRPLWSTWLNWGRNTLGTAPFVVMGGAWAGASGVLIGQAIGGVVFGILGLFLALRLVDGYSSERLDPEKGFKHPVMRDRAENAMGPPRR